MAIKVFCKKCRGFLGLIQNDGTFPCADDCPSGRYPNKDCPVLEDLRKQNRGIERPTHISGHGGPLDPDSGGYQSIARRILEDG